MAKKSVVKIPIVLEEGVQMPMKGSDGAVAYDLTARKSFKVHSGAIQKIRTGVSIALPKGYMAEVKGRSGLALKGLWVHSGTIDTDYRGDISVICTHVHKTQGHHYRISAGDRIAQLIIRPVVDFEFEETDELDETDRGTDGFGSTGN